MSSITGHRRIAAAVAGAVMLSSLGLAGCGVINKINKISNAVQNNKSTIDDFTSKLQSGQGTAFEATYVTTGSAPATVVYAVQPPKGLAFKEIPSGGSNAGTTVDLVVNASGEFVCTPGVGTGPRWACQKLGKTNKADTAKIFDVYTSGHWVAFLKGLALAAGFAGDKVTTSSMTVNGVKMSCVDFRAGGIPGLSTICSTPQGILGYVKVAGDSTSFEIKSYTTSPSAALFRLPKGAKIVRPRHKH